jgi:hypothetical protein
LICSVIAFADYKPTARLTGTGADRLRPAIPARSAASRDQKTGTRSEEDIKKSKEAESNKKQEKRGVKRAEVQR